ncbi:hypothetical protein F8S09_17305, partial [Deinococcus sp. SDU3-2]
MTSDGRFFRQTKSGAIRSGDVSRFFQHLLRQIQGEIVVVLDNAGIDRSKATQAFVAHHERLSLVFLPPYAPELSSTQELHLHNDGEALPAEKIWECLRHRFWGSASAFWQMSSWPFQ